MNVRVYVRVCAFGWLQSVPLHCEHRDQSSPGSGQRDGRAGWDRWAALSGNLD